MTNEIKDKNNENNPTATINPSLPYRSVITQRLDFHEALTAWVRFKRSIVRMGLFSYRLKKESDQISVSEDCIATALMGNECVTWDLWVTSFVSASVHLFLGDLILQWIQVLLRLGFKFKGTRNPITKSCLSVWLSVSLFICSSVTKLCFMNHDSQIVEVSEVVVMYCDCNYMKKY